MARRSRPILTWLTNERQVSAATHKQALSALLFFYSKVLQVDLPGMSEMSRPRIQRRLPVVLSQDEVAAVFRGPRPGCAAIVASCAHA